MSGFLLCHLKPELYEHRIDRKSWVTYTYYKLLLSAPIMHNSSSTISMQEEPTILNCFGNRSTSMMTKLIEENSWNFVIVSNQMVRASYTDIRPVRIFQLYLYRPLRPFLRIRRILFRAPSFSQYYFFWANRNRCIFGRRFLWFGGKFHR